MSKTKTKGRSISRVKRGNQKRNKLIKKGKLKPKSHSPFVAAQAAKGAENRAKKDRAKKKNQDNGVKVRMEVEEDVEVPEEDMMDEDDALMLHRLSKGKGATVRGDSYDEDDDLADMEEEAVKRYEERRGTGKVERALLPTKTKEGVHMKTVEVEDKEEEDSDEEGEDEEEAMDDQEDEEDGEQDDGLVLDGQGSKSVVSLLAEREEALAKLKLRVGTLASNFVEAPEERMHQLDKLVKMIDAVPVQIKGVGFKLVVTTVIELLKDIIPSYPISAHSQQDSQVMQKKETLRLQKFEGGILSSAKSVLVKLEKLIKVPHTVTTPCGLHALRSACDLLVTHPQFNYSQNILKLVVPAMDSPSAAVRSTVLSAVQQVFREDKRGESTLVAARYIRGHVKARRYRCRPEMVEAFLAVRLSYIERALADKQEEREREEAKKKTRKGREEMSKRERKRQRQLKKVEREMLEARGEEAKEVRNRNYTEVSKIIFEILFRVIKSVEEHGMNRLLPAALRCISAFCHTINVDFFDDLLKVMSDLVKGGTLKRGDELLCIKTAFDVLSGPGEFLTYDPGNFSRALFQHLPQLTAHTSAWKKDGEIGQRPVSVACAIVKKMLVARKRLVSKDLVQCFAKGMAKASLQLEDEGDQIEVLSTLDEVRRSHVATFASLLDTEEEQVPLASVAGLGIGAAKQVNSFSMWELKPMLRHSSREVALAAAKVLNSK